MQGVSEDLALAKMWVAPTFQNAALVGAMPEIPAGLAS
jgi:hypothetical protein